MKKILAIAFLPLALLLLLTSAHPCCKEPGRTHLYQNQRLPSCEYPARC